MSTARSTGDSSSGTKKHRPKLNPIVVAPSAPKKHYTLPPYAGADASTADGKTPGTKDGAGSGGSGGSGGGISAAEKRANAKEAKAKRDAANRYREQAANLEVQAAALRHALSIDFSKQLHQQLADIGQVLGQQQRIVREGYRQRVHQLGESVEENETARGAQTSLNTQNRINERTSALEQVSAQGAGETDALRAQLMSLRNWSANQNEVERSYFDTLRSVNQGLTDLNIDTKTALVNNAIQANADKEQMWTNYYNQKSEAYTQLGNVRGQQADYYASAKEMGGKGDGGKAKGGAAGAFMAAAKMQGKSWDNPGVSKKLMGWEGHDQFEAKPTNLSKIQNAQTVDLGKRPEGASLRSW